MACGASTGVRPAWRGQFSPLRPCGGAPAALRPPHRAGSHAAAVLATGARRSAAPARGEATQSRSRPRLATPARRSPPLLGLRTSRARPPGASRGLSPCPASQDAGGGLLASRESLSATEGRRLVTGGLAVCITTLAACSVSAGVVSSPDGEAVAAVFLSVELLYLALHVQPLLPSAPAPPTGYMRCFTTGEFFASEVSLLLLVLAASPVREMVPAPVLWSHVSVHLLYTVLATVAPEWSVRQNTLRVGARLGLSREGLWAGLLNTANAADAGLHAVYCAALAAAPPPPLIAAAAAAAAAAYGALGVAIPRAVSRDDRRARAGGGSRASAPPRGVGRGDSQATEEEDGRGLVVVTGGTSGIGAEVARDMAASGRPVLLTSRSPSRAEAAARAIRDAHPGARAEGAALDLSSVRDVERFARELAARGEGVAVLIANAGLSQWWPYMESEDGVELNFAANHLGHHCLAVGALPLLRGGQGGGSRVVLVSSEAHRWCPGALASRIRSGDLTPLGTAWGGSGGGYTGGSSPWGAYGVSKLGNILLARELARRAPEGCTVVSVHPGVAPTGLQRGMGPAGSALTLAERALGLTVERAAARVVDAAEGRVVAGGGGVYLVGGEANEGSRLSRDDALARAVWDACEGLRLGGGVAGGGRVVAAEGREEQMSDAGS